MYDPLRFSVPGDRAARSVALFFLVVAGIGAVPALLYGPLYGIVGGMAVIGATTSFAPAGLLGLPIYLAGLAFIMFGFRQLGFFYGRARGDRDYSRRWWLYVAAYNGALGLASLAMVFDDSSAVIVFFWFGGLTLLALLGWDLDGANKWPGAKTRPGDRHLL